MLLSLAGIYLKNEVSLDADQRNRQRLHIQFEPGSQSRFFINTAASFYAGAAEPAEVHVGIELDLKAFIVEREIESALDSEYAGDIEFAAPLYQECTGIYGLLNEVIRYIARIGVDLQAHDSLFRACCVDLQTEVA